MKIKVIKNIGRRSKSAFGAPGTILHLKGNYIEGENPQDVVSLSATINTIDDLNCYTSMSSDLETIFEEVKEVEIKFKVRVKKNIGAKSLETFGKPGTILEVTDYEVRSVEKNLLGQPKYGINLKYLLGALGMAHFNSTIHSFGSLNNCINHLSHPDYQTKFEEIKDFKKESEIISKKIINIFNLDFASCYKFGAIFGNEVYELDTNDLKLKIEIPKLDVDLVSSITRTLELIKGWGVNISISWNKGECDDDA